MRIGSLFSGIGGLELGLEAVIPGARVIWQAESDPVARAVLATHWPGVRIYEDVRHIDETAEPVDIICGGFPCQDLSVAGKGRGLGAERSGLWWEFRRIVRTLRPRYVLIENVYRGWRRWLPVVRRSLHRIGYTSVPVRVRAADVGAPHERARCFVVAYPHGGLVRDAEQRQPSRRPRGVRDEGLTLAGHAGAPMADADGGRCEIVGRAEPHGLEGARGSLADGRGDARGEHRFPPGPDGMGLWDGPQPAVRRGDDGVSHGVVPPRAKQLRLLGNAVVPQCAAQAWKAIVDP